MPLAAKEGSFSTFSDPCVFFPLAAFEGIGENSRLGFGQRKTARHRGNAWSNSAGALGIEEALPESRGGCRSSGNSNGATNNKNVAKSVTSQCLAEYNSSKVAKGVQFFSLYHLVTDFQNAWAAWTLLPAGKYALAKTASWISGQIGTTEFLSVTGATSSTVIPSTTTAVVDLAETAGKAGAAPAIVTSTGLDVLANAGCATIGRQAAGQMTPLPPGWASSF